MRRALLSRSGWEQTAARQTQRCSPPQRMQSRFSEFPYYRFFSSFFLVLWGRIGLTLPQQSRRLHRQTRRLGRQQGCGAKTAHRDGKRHHRRGHHLARRTAPSFFGVPVSFRLIPPALPPSCILTRPLAAESASNAIYTFIVYTQSQAPVNVLRCLVQGVSWKFSTIADTPCGKRIRAAVLLHQNERKKLCSERDFLRFPLAVLTRVWYHDGHAAFAAP